MTLVLLALSGCVSRAGGGDSAANACSTTDPSVQIGNGESAHTPVEVGDVVTMVHGSQGGWHVWYSFEAYNFGPTVTFGITGDDSAFDDLLVNETLNQALVITGDPVCAGEAYGVFGFLPLDDPKTTDVDESPPAHLVGHQMVMGVTVTDLTDATITAHDEVTVTLACDPVDVGVYPECG